ncbi:hypothetical protein H2198_003764 [Neophaeococcomyces mojaviensis]|uniref:Uncharacterized protein n=1 Tax=Neophaeococcomyces mojaviensis TaxID=3383035 RepID=A0ACC3AAS7_9EURO|nr:hypothetical protein H2198_003764 [Knufia sp. JES_112]
MPQLSQTTSASSRPMEVLDPSPVDETPPPFPSHADDMNSEIVNPEDLIPAKNPSYFPPTSDGPDSITTGPSRSTTNTLGSRSNVPHILLALQKYSTFPPAVYLIGHYANTALIPLFSLSTATAERSLLLTRPYYQSFPLEPLLIFVPVITHVASGLSLRIYRRFQAAKRYGAETHAERKQITKTLWPKLSLTSLLGYMLYPMLVAHVLVNRITPLKVHGDSSSVGLRFFSHGVKRHPWLSNIGYTFLVSVASWHFVGGAAKYLRLTREYVTEGGDYGARKRTVRDRVINGLSAVVATMWALGGLGVIGRGVGSPAASAWEMKQWDEVYRAVPVVGGMM